MTTVIGQQFSDLTKHEEQFGNSEACGYVNCERTPTTHYALCPEDNCLSREPVCSYHAAMIQREKNLPLGLYTLICSFHDCTHKVFARDVHLFPK